MTEGETPVEKCERHRSARACVHAIVACVMRHSTQALYAERNVAKGSWPTSDVELAELLDGERWEFEQALAAGDVEGAKRECADVVLYMSMRIYEMERATAERRRG